MDTGIKNSKNNESFALDSKAFLTFWILLFISCAVLIFSAQRYILAKYAFKKVHQRAFFGDEPGKNELFEFQTGYT